MPSIYHALYQYSIEIRRSENEDAELVSDHYYAPVGKGSISLLDTSSSHDKYDNQSLDRTSIAEYTSLKRSQSFSEYYHMRTSLAKSPLLDFRSISSENATCTDRQLDSNKFIRKDFNEDTFHAPSSNISPLSRSDFEGISFTFYTHNDSSESAVPEEKSPFACDYHKPVTAKSSISNPDMHINSSIESILPEHSSNFKIDFVLRTASSMTSDLLDSDQLLNEVAPIPIVYDTGHLHACADLGSDVTCHNTQSLNNCVVKNIDGYISNFETKQDLSREKNTKDSIYQDVPAKSLSQCETHHSIPLTDEPWNQYPNHSFCHKSACSDYMTSEESKYYDYVPDFFSQTTHF